MQVWSAVLAESEQVKSLLWGLIEGAQAGGAEGREEGVKGSTERKK